MNSLKLTISTLFLSIGLIGFCQSTSIPNVLNLKSAKQSGEIIENQKLVGYFVFYFKEKADKKNSTYEVSLFDDNWKPKKSFEITRPKKAVLLETVYNGTCFLLYFYDSKTGLELVTFDKTGKQRGSAIIAEVNNYEKQRISASLSSGTDNVSIYPLGTEGFVRQSFPKNKKLGYEITGYNNEMKELWKIASAEDSKLIETVEISEVSNKFITATVYRKKNLMTKEVEAACIIIAAETGKKVCELALGSDEKGRLSLLKSVYMEKDENFLIVGEFYKAGDDILKDKSQGLYVQKVSESGKEESMKQFKWKGDIDKYKQENMDEEDKKDANKPFYIFFHDVIISQSGHVFLVGEQFKKQISATAVAGKALGILAVAAGGSASNDASNFEIRIANMVVIELDEKTNMIDFDLIQKKKTSVLLPSGAGLWSTAYLGYYVNAMGNFDYRFTSQDKEKDKYTIVYTDFNRKAEGSKDKADCMLGVIHIDQGQKINSRTPVNSEARNFWIQPAKPGHVAIGEYFKKEKKINFRLEPLKY